MNEKVTVDLDRDTLEALGTRAEAHGRTIPQEVQEILRTTVRRRMTPSEFISRAEAIAAMTPKDVRQTASQILLREDRDR